jgi:hypothetical protein
MITDWSVPPKAISQTAGMRGYGESDESVVSKKPVNRIQTSQWDFPEAELVEKRDSIKRNAFQPGTSRTQSRNQRCHPGWNVCVKTNAWDRFDAITQDKSRVR